ncbi:MAG: DoxX family protein [Candidatus Kapabacteria bacterium]|nr:DoxX family protein [Candidatus Kapabacteria bacterium]MDW8011805.1 DoxX family protein [Bacteroidota bacterium]
MFGLYWLYNALNHLLIAPKALSEYAALHGVPAPTLAVYVGGILLAVGGITILSGMYVPVGVAALVAFLGLVTFWMHAFWRVRDPVQRMVELTQFTKNMALIGATLLLLAIPESWWKLAD